MAATTSSGDSSERIQTAGETSRRTKATDSTRLWASLLGNKPVAPWPHSTGVFGIDLTIGVSLGSQLCSCLTEIPGHMVTTVGRASASNVLMTGASWRATSGTSAGRVQMKRICGPKCCVFSRLQIAGSRLSVVTNAEGYCSFSALACADRRAVMEIEHWSFQALVE